MSGIFISYRREDSEKVAHRLYRELRAHFGVESVFIDVENIDLGENFAQVIDEKVGFCDTLIAVIGKKWLTSTGVDGRRRLDDPQDWVRLEIASALSRGIKVIPVLVDGAMVPDQRNLPVSLSALAQAQVLDLKADRFEQGIARLTTADRSGASSADQAIIKMQEFVQTIGLFGIVRVFVAFVAATFLWVLFFAAVFESFRTLHRLSKRVAVIAFGLGLIGTLGFVTFVVTPQLGAVYRLFAS